MSEHLSLDRTSPNPLPSSQDLQSIFMYKLRVPNTSGEAHFRAVSHLVLVGEKLLGVSDALHRTLSVRSHYNDFNLPGRSVGRGEVGLNPLIKHMGIDRYRDFELKAMHAVRPLLDSILYGDDEPHQKLQLVALTTGAMIGEAQAYSDANTRIARTVHDFILGGLNAVDVGKTSDVTRNFSLPAHLEDQIMLQNLTQLVEYPDETPRYGDVIGVTNKTVDLYQQAYGYIDRLAGVASSSTTAEASIALSQNIDARLSGEFKKHAQHAPEYDEPSLAKAVLSQKCYGPAALAAAFGDTLPESIDIESAARLVKANVELMTMRTVSIGTAMARRGLFMSVESSHAGGGTYFSQTHWLPENI